MKKFDSSSMPETTSPTVRNLRTFVEQSIENEIEQVAEEYGQDTADIAEKALRSLAFNIFHKNPEVHAVAKQNMFAYDQAITTLFAISEDSINLEDRD